MMLRMQAATKALCRTQHPVPSPRRAPRPLPTGGMARCDLCNQKFEAPAGAAAIAGVNNFPFAFDKSKERLNVTIQRKKKKSFKMYTVGRASVA